MKLLNLTRLQTRLGAWLPSERSDVAPLARTRHPSVGAGPKFCTRSRTTFSASLRNRVASTSSRLLARLLCLSATQKVRLQSGSRQGWSVRT